VTTTTTLSVKDLKTREENMWSQTVGLVNGQYKYLTAETFGYKINCNGATMKKKQQWTIEPFSLESGQVDPANDEFAEQEHVAIKSHLDCYLAVDSFGNVTCESRELHPGARFTITICSMTTGDGEQIYWAFRNVERGYFLGASSDGMINCIAKIPQSKAELWHLHLIPARGSTMFALKSIGRKRYARSVRLSDGGGEQVQVDSTSPWGAETLFQFKYYEGGRYALLTSSCKYLTSEGTCIDWTPPFSPSSPGKNGVHHANGNGVSITIKSAANGNGVISSPSPIPPPETLFTLEYHGGDVAFRDSQGRYLAAAGRAAVLRTRSTHVSRDELLSFEPAPLQVAFRADFNNRYVSIKQGVDLSANQSDVTSEHETFQLEYNIKSDTWNIRTKDGQYWNPGAASAIQVSSRSRESSGFFKLKWNEDGTCSLLYSDSSGIEDDNSRWVCARKSGQLCLSQTDPVGFHLLLRNRTSLNLRPASGSGFVGLKQPGLGKLDVSKTSPDSVLIEYVNSETDEDVAGSFNCCLLKMPSNGKYWSVVDGNQAAADASSPSCAQQFILEIRSGFTLAIRLLESPSYFNLTKQSTLSVTKCQPNEATLWEF